MFQKGLGVEQRTIVRWPLKIDGIKSAIKGLTTCSLLDEMFSEWADFPHQTHFYTFTNHCSLQYILVEMIVISPQM